MIRELVLVCTAFGCSYAHVGAGEMAVVRTPDGVEQHAYPPGDWHIGVLDHATKYSVRSQEREERLDVQSSDGLGITLETSIRFHAIPTEVVALDQELGQDYYAVLLGPTLRSQARRVVGRFKPEEIYSSQREVIERQIREGVENAIRGRHVALEAVLVRNVALPQQLQAKITDKLAQEQEALKQQAEDQEKLAATKAEAERQRIQADAQAEAARVQAQGAADAARITAQAAADAKRIDGQATAEYEKLILSNLTPAMLHLREIEAERAFAQSPNAKLVLMGSAGAHALLDLRGAASGKATYP